MNYFNALSDQEKSSQLAHCRFMERGEFDSGTKVLEGKNIVIVGCGAQGLNQGLNMRDSGLNISYALRAQAIETQNESYKRASDNGFTVGNYQELIPEADLVINLTPDKQHTAVVNAIMPLMKQNSVLSYSHGFNIVEEGTQIRPDITVIMVAPKCPGTEVREEYKRGFGVPTLIAVHPENDSEQKGLEWAKAYAVATGGHRAGVLHSSFVAEVKSDLMGEQTILCGVLQSASLLCFDLMKVQGVDPAYASKLIQNGWEVLTEDLKHGGISQMMDRLEPSAYFKAFQISNELKRLMRPLFQKHMDDILDGTFSTTMMVDWNNDDQNLLKWRNETGESEFEQTPGTEAFIAENEYYEHGILMVAFIRAGVELAFDIMVDAGIKEESAYYESLHEAPLIANTIARKKLFEMNRIISDTAEYGCYLFTHSAIPLLKPFIESIDSIVIGSEFKASSKYKEENYVKARQLVNMHAIERIGTKLRAAMTEMKPILN